MYCFYLLTSSKSEDSNLTLSSLYDLASSISNDSEITNPVVHDCNEGKQNEWLVLEDRYFFKKTASFYFIDTKFIRMFMMIKGKIYSEHFSLNLVIETGMLTNLTQAIDDTRIKRPNFFLNYGYSLIDATFDLKLLLDKHHVEPTKLKMHVHIKNRRTNVTSNSSVQLKIKYFKQQNKSDSLHSKKLLLCVKCLYLQDKDHKDFRWWLEANRLIGYNKIVICNQSIEGSPNLNQVFADYKKLVQVTHLKCLPNFHNITQSKFGKTFDDIRTKQKRFDQVANRFNFIVLNECYLNNIDKYDYIAVHDHDELIVPQVSEHANTLARNRAFIRNFNLESFNNEKKMIPDKCDGLQKWNDSNKMSSYLKQLTEYNHLGLRPSSIMFYQGQFLHATIIEAIFKEISNSRMQAHWAPDRVDFVPITFRIDDLVYSQEMNKTMNLTIIVNDQTELDYAMSLFKLYKIYVKPFFEKNKDVLANLTDGRFDRAFVYLYNHDPYVKTIHNTERTLEVCLDLEECHL